MGSSKKQTIGYRYLLDVHAILTHTAERLLNLKFDKRGAWEGNTTGGDITVSAPDLFGGDQKEGGVSGTVEFARGLPTQGRNAYLQGILGTAIPAFRGVSGLIFKQFYFGMNPYLKTWSARLQRIHSRTDGSAQWYDAKAAVGSTITRTPSDSPLPWADRGTDFFNIGASQETSGSYNSSSFQSWFKGYIDSVRVTKGVPRYTSTSFTPPTAEFPTDLNDPYWANVVTLLKFNGANGATTTTCEKGNPVTLNNGAVISTAQSKFGGSSCFFDGVDDWVKVTVGAANQNLGASWTVEGWVYLTGYVTNAHGSTVLSAGPVNLGGSDTDLGVTGSGNIAFEQFEANSDPRNIIVAGTLEVVPLGRWVHVAWTRDGNTNKLYMHVDGRLATGTSVGTDMNPAHILRECLTDQVWGMGYLDADIDDVSFMAAADTMAAEGMGMSLLWDRQMPLEDFIKEVIRHICAALYVSRTTGKYVLKLIRKDYVEASLPVLDKNNVDRVEGFGFITTGELVNSVTVNFWDSATNTTGSVTENDPALVQMQAAEINTTIQYPGFTNHDIAARAALRDLRTLSTPLRSCTVYAQRRAAGSYNIGDVFKLDWPEFSPAPTVMRVTGLALGDGRSNLVRLTVAQDAFALPVAPTRAPPDTLWVDPSRPATAASNRVVIEAPYYELVQRQGQATVDSVLSTAPDASYVLATAQRPGTAVNANVEVDDGSGYADGGDTDFSPVATLLIGVDKNATQFQINPGTDYDQVEPGTTAQIGNELVAIVTKTAGMLVVKRAVLDTLPEDHVAGDVLIFWDAFAAVVDTQFATGETVNVKLLPSTGSNTLDIAAAPADALTFAGRAFAPYPPAKLTVNGGYWTQQIAASADLALTWAHRDRKQQTSGTYYGWTDGSIGPEAGVTYTLRIYGENDNLLRTESVSGTSYTYTNANEITDNGGTAGAPYATQAAAQGPLGYWRLNETTGDFIDTVGSYHAVLTGTPTRGDTGLLTGDSDKALTWTGTTQYAQTAADNRWQLGNGDFTVMCMVKFTSNTFSTLMAIRIGTGLTDMVCLLTTSRIAAGDISAETWDWQTVASRVRTATAKNDGLPHHVAVTFRASTAELRLYVDGALVDTRVQAGTRPTGTGNTYKVTIGNNTTFNQGNSTATQDELALYGVELSAGTIATLASAALNGPTPTVTVNDDYSSDTTANYTQSATTLGTWAVSGGLLAATVAGNAQSVFTRNDVSTADATLSAVVTQGSDAGLVLRFQDNNNYYLAVVCDASSASGTPNVVKLYKRVGGTFTQIGTNQTIAFTRGTSHTLGFAVSGNALTVSFDGVTKISATDSALTAAGKVGVRANDSPATFDSFTVSYPAPVRVNGKLRFELESTRGGVKSWKKYNWTVNRYGMGFGYGLYWGGYDTAGYGWGNNWGNYYGGVN